MEILYCLVTYLIIGVSIFIIDCFCEGIKFKRTSVEFKNYALILTWPFELSFSLGAIVGYFYRIITKKGK